MTPKPSRLLRYGKALVLAPFIALGFIAMIFTYLATGKTPSPRYYRKRDGGFG